MNSAVEDEQLNTPETPTVSEALEIVSEATESPQIEESTGEIQASMKSCKSCQKMKTCIFFRQQIAHEKSMAEQAGQMLIQLDMFPAEHIGARCSEYLGVVQKA